MSFNLVDEGWIPCLLEANGRLAQRELGLRDTLEHAPFIHEIADASPLTTLCLHRLLLAILHRIYGPADARAWATLWRMGHWETGRLAKYFERWRHRFDLFDSERPFYQCHSLDFQYAVPASKLGHELAPLNNPRLFDHTSDEAPRTLTPAEAARYLLVQQAFAVGGLVSFEKGQDRLRFGSAKAAPLVRAAVALVKGSNLFETLMLNLHRYSREDGEPFDAEEDDMPAWEREEEPRAEDRWPRGYLDLLTWQSRRIRLQPEVDEDGRVVVRKVVVMKGNQLAEGCWRHGRETMLAFRKKDKPLAGEEPWPPVGFVEDKSLWRDSLALFQSMSEQHARPKTLDWLSDLVADGTLAETAVFPLDLHGLVTDRAKVLFWRHERLPLPLAFLENRDLVEALRLALELAEAVGRALGQSGRTLARLLLNPGAEQASPRARARDDVDSLARNLAPERLYWPRLEAPFRAFLVLLAKDQTTADDGGVAYGTTALPIWAATLRQAARDAFTELSGSLDTSARALKAVAKAEQEFHHSLSEIFSRDFSSLKEVTA